MMTQKAFALKARVRRSSLPRAGSVVFLEMSVVLNLNFVIQLHDPAGYEREYLSHWACVSA